MFYAIVLFDKKESLTWFIKGVFSTCELRSGLFFKRNMSIIQYLKRTLINCHVWHLKKKICLIVQKIIIALKFIKKIKDN